MLSLWKFPLTHLMCPFLKKLLKQKYKKDKSREKERKPRGLKLTQKGKYMDSVQSKSKIGGKALYTLLVKNNGYVPSRINTLHTVVRRVIKLTK